MGRLVPVHRGERHLLHGLRASQREHRRRVPTEAVVRHHRSVPTRRGADYAVLQEGPRRRRRRGPRVRLNAVGWLALLGVAAVVSVAASLILPTAYAVASGLAAAGLAYGTETYFTVRR